MLKARSWKKACLRFVLLFINALLLQFMFGSSVALALSSACTTLNAASGSSTYTSRIAASDFASGETVTVSFSDYGTDPKTNQTVSGVVRLSTYSLSVIYSYSSYTGAAGNYSYTLDSSTLTTNGLYLNLNARTYLSTFTITCSAAVATDATLSALTLSAGTLNPSFSSTTTSYSAAVTSDVSSVTVSPVTTDSNATVRVNNTTVTSGSSATVSLATGANTITVMTTAADGVTTMSYTVTVTRAEAAPVAANSSATVAANSSNNAITPVLSGGTATAVSIVTQPAHGSASASGTAITYTPVAGYSGSDSFTYTARNAAGTSSTATVAITVVPATLSVSPAAGALAGATVGTSWSQTFSTAGGTTPYRYSISAGSLPDGLTLNGTSGVLSGSPTTAGTYNFTVSVTDAYGAAGSAAYSLTVAEALPVAGSTSAAVAANSSSNGITLALSGGAATSVAVTSQPAHGSASASGTSITYTPAAGYSGSDSFTYTASNSAGTSSAATVTITVTSAVLNLTPAGGSLSGATVGSVWSQTLSASGGTAPYSYSASGLPAGLTLNSSTGVISGAPTTAGSYTISVSVTDALSSAGSATYSLAVAQALPVAGSVSATVAANSSNNAITLALSGGAATSVAVASQPAHGSASASGTSITYTPTAGYSGSDSFTYTASNSSGMSSAATVTMTVTASSTTISLTPASGALAAGTVGTPWSQNLMATGGTAPYSYTVSGTLPTGITLSNGTLAGTPTVATTASFTVTASDANGAQGQANYSLTISADAPVISDQSTAVQAGESVTVDLTAGVSGGPFTSAELLNTPDAAQGTAALSGSGNSWQLTFNASATASGTVVLRYRLTNQGGVSNSASLTIQISAKANPAQNADVVGLVSAQGQAVQQFATAQIVNFNQRLELLHDDRMRFSDAFGLKLNLAQSSDRQPRRMLEAERQFNRYNGRDPLDVPDAVSLPDLGFGRDGKLSVWTGGHINFGQANVDSVQLKHTLSGVSTGADYRFTPTLVAGVGLGYGSYDSEIGNDGSKNKGRSISTALYGSYHPGRLFFDTMLGYSRLDFTTRRYVSEIDNFAHGDRGGKQFFASLTSGWQWRGTDWQLAPYARIQSAWTQLEAFVERDAGGSNLAYSSQSLNMVSGALGVRSQYALALNSGGIRFHNRLEYNQQISDAGEGRVGYASVSDSSYVLTTRSLSEKVIAVELGADLQLPWLVTPGLAYQGNFGLENHFREHGVVLQFTSSF